MQSEVFLRSVSKKASQDTPAEFTGLGIILVEENIGSLPVSPLLSGSNSCTQLSDTVEIVDYLFSISNTSDKRHDGFHIVSRDKGLLEISQYFSPQIPKGFNGTIFDVGARYRTAQYGSLYKNVISIIVVSQSGEVSIAKDGEVELITA